MRRQENDTGIKPLVAYWITVAIPVTPPPEIPLGIRNDVQLQQYRKAPIEIRRYSLINLSFSFFTLANYVDDF